MRKFNIFTVFLIVGVMLFTAFLPAASALTYPDIQADSALLVEAGSGQILYEKNKDKRVAPGGFTKIMTVLLAVEAVESGVVKLNDSVTASESALNAVGENDFKQNIAAGETIKIQDLLYCAYLASASDACDILAERLAGSTDAFTEKMNGKAATLGCSGTHFANADGSPDEGQYTTAWDQYTIFKAALSHQLFRQIAGMLSYRTDGNTSSPSRNIENSNLMLHEKSQYYYKYCVAGKTDAETDGNYSFIGNAKSSDEELISVVLGDGFVQTEGGAMEVLSYTETKRLFDWGFNGFAWQTVIDKNEIVASEPVELAKGTGAVDLKPTDMIAVLARTDLGPADVRRDIVIYGKPEGKLLKAPIKEGDILGELTVTIDGTVRVASKLVAVRDVGLDREAYLKDQVRGTLTNIWVELGAALLLLFIAGYIWLVIRDRKARREKQRVIEETKQKLIEDRRNMVNREIRLDAARERVKTYRKQK
jgi:D-alanyl-D-alanine carboxypeptidase (penicillin-binding protein 5/6)